MEGRKHVLAIREGTAENAIAAKEPLEDLNFVPNVRNIRNHMK
ncbi:MAG: hypothetical protein ACRD44_07010 [Bryobacteraceae bacterium]